MGAAYDPCSNHGRRNFRFFASPAARALQNPSRPFTSDPKMTPGEHRRSPPTTVLLKRARAHVHDHASQPLPRHSPRRLAARSPLSAGERGEPTTERPLPPAYPWWRQRPRPPPSAATVRAAARAARRAGAATATIPSRLAVGLLWAAAGTTPAAACDALGVSPSSPSSPRARTFVAAFDVADYSPRRPWR